MPKKPAKKTPPNKMPMSGNMMMPGMPMMDMKKKPKKK